ncbi:hypothetical protein K432DRAFT_146043 [Lepidopterella palustris CBS 459.81]|uniref:Uncharacterized protein n=1 Tax=Lepidopterella palustris CBS 459.81 TaxID=1314670 RepID=A0A8E2E316_9PEZI|nr:hypothetical protein K432DRAFT_146043 [Lepidopterella palustris CBS 459.81]
MHPLTYRMKLAEAKGGASCLVPRDAKVGDLICQLTGSPVPFNLTPRGDEQWKWKDIGPLLQVYRKGPRLDYTIIDACYWAGSCS